MRPVSEQPVESWDPPSYRVDRDGKVVGALPGPNHNWGRWGPLDQRGTANLLTPSRVTAAVALARTGRQISLALPIGGDQPNPGTRDAPRHLMHRPLSDAVVGDTALGIESSDDLIVLPLQATTQLDGHGHFAHGHVLYNGYWAGLVTGRGGARRLGIHHHANGIVGRGVLLDVARFAALDPFTDVIGPDLLDATAAAQGVEVRGGDILLVRTGWLGAWLGDPALRRRQRSTGLSLDTVEWIAAADVAMVAADNRTVEAIPGPADHPLLPFHRAALRDLGLLLGELFELDELAADCAADGVYEFFFAAMPLPVVNAVGSPLNPLVLK
jgi:kynurenine formamidase